MQAKNIEILDTGENNKVIYLVAKFLRINYSKPRIVGDPIVSFTVKDKVYLVGHDEDYNTPHNRDGVYYGLGRFIAKMRETHPDYRICKNNAFLYKNDLSYIDMSRVSLQNANMFGANLRQSILTKSDLTNADLTGANLTGADLSNANLSRANLYSANLTNCNLTGAKLNGTQLYGANLKGVDLSNVDLTGADLSGVKYDSTTIFSEGFDMDSLKLQISYSSLK